jgi:hypothetical protein
MIFETRVKQVVCDHTYEDGACQAALFVDSSLTDAETRLAIAKRGWGWVGEKEYCPKHAPGEG